MCFTLCVELIGLAKIQLGMVRDLAEYKHIHNKNLSLAAHCPFTLQKASFIASQRQRTTTIKTKTFE
ncbi:hypothetical protein ACQ4LE_000508 [Meloidogyne hapla]